MQQGLIVKSYGFTYIVETQDKSYTAVTRSKNNNYVVGDLVWINILNNTQAQITSLIPRTNLIYRSDKNRSKIIASNIDLLVIVIAVKPNFNPNFLNSALICAESTEIKPIIVINKTDLLETFEFAEKIEDLYAKKLAYTVLKLSAIDNATVLLPLLNKQQSLLIGQSGMGKSTLTNAIYPKAQAKTNLITLAQTSGKHTTTWASLYHLNQVSTIIDSPGLQEFGLYHLNPNNLASYFPEMHKYLGLCKFNNCRHLAEPECAIISAASKGIVNQERYTYYTALLTKLLDKKLY